ncbi:hypothetical protein [Anatilimnocola aggregata]|uniref:hypothetical protein n=1 Tax=Anatilimnocola aggregata TaxID=2528021 RepID=UPI00119E54CA|nr:hypothetical protein [Anatilimnocola aggregata]
MNFVIYSEHRYQLIVDAAHEAEHCIFETWLKASLNPGVVVHSEGSNASNVSPIREIIFDALVRNSEIIDQCYDRIGTALQRPRIDSTRKFDLPLGAEYASDLKSSLCYLNSSPDIDGMADLWSLFEPSLYAVEDSARSTRMRIRLTTDEALNLREALKRVRECLRNLVEEGKRALRLDVLSPKYHYADLLAENEGNLLTATAVTAGNCPVAITIEDTDKPNLAQFPRNGSEAVFDANAELDKLMTAVPAFDRASPLWVSAKEAANVERVKIATLRTNRHAGKKSTDGCFGCDNRGRIWRSQGPNSHKWYLRMSLRDARSVSGQDSE